MADITTKSGLRELFNSKIYCAELLERPASHSECAPHQGMRIVTECGQYLVHKLESSSKAVVTHASNMSSQWKLKQIVSVTKQVTVNEVIKMADKATSLTLSAVFVELTQSEKSAKGGSGLTLADLKRRTGVSDTQLDTEIIEHDLYILAGCFDNVETYLLNLGLSPGQQTDIKDLALRRSTQLAMSEALKLWRSPNPLAATFRALLTILLDLKRGDVAVNICQYIAGRDRVRQ